MERIFKTKVVNALILLVFLSTFGHLLSGCNSSTSEDTSNLTDISSGDTGSTDTGTSENVTHKSGEEITSAQTWSGTHTLAGNLYIKSVVEIAPCTKILIASNSRIKVFDNGAIKAIGSEECPIIFTSAKQTAGKGDWYEVAIHNTASADNAFEWTVFEFGGGNDYGMLWVDSGASVYINNSKFSNSSSYGVYFESGAKLSSFKGNQFDNLDMNPIFIGADEVGALDTIETSNITNNTVKIKSGGEVVKAALWKHIGVPYELSGNLYIKAGVEIAACNKLLIAANSRIKVSDNGSIKAIGDENCPITFSSAKSSPGKGDWYEVAIHNTASADNAFEWTVFEFGGGNDYGMLWAEEGVSVKINNSVFRNSSSYGIYFDNGVNIISFKGNKFSDLDMNPIFLSLDELGMLDTIESSNNSKNTILVESGGTVTKAALWKYPGIPLEFEGDQYIEAAVEVEAGNTILMGPNARIKVYDSGSFKLTGSATSPITIKSAKSSPAAGDWYEVDIKETAGEDNIWNYVNVMHGGGDGYGQLLVYQNASITLNNCSFTLGETCDVYIYEGAQVTNNGSTYTVCQH